MILGFKGFKPGLVATLGNGKFQYVPNELNETKKAMCASTGFHYCLDPWDCLNWYTWNGKNEFWAVAAGGDVDEDGYGSRSSCTELVPLRKLTAEEFLLMHANYVFEHPAEKFEDSYKGPFHVAYGRDKKLAGELGEWLCFIIQDQQESIPAIRSKGYGPQGHSFGASRRGMESGFAAIWCISISAIIGQNWNFMAGGYGGRTERPSSSGNAAGARKRNILCASARSYPQC